MKSKFILEILKMKPFQENQQLKEKFDQQARRTFKKFSKSRKDFILKQSQ